MRILLGLLALLATTSFCLAEEPEKAAKDSEEVVQSPLPAGAKPIAIHKLTRTQKFQHFYSVSPDEVKNLLENGNDAGQTFKYWGIVGYGSSKPGKGLAKLHRVLVDAYATFYVEAPKKLNPRAVVHPFPVWVWEKPGPGLVPVYACSAKNWRNMLFSTSREHIKQAMETSYNLTKRKLEYHGIVFYVMPANQSEAATESKIEAEPEAKTEADKTEKD